MRPLVCAVLLNEEEAVLLASLASPSFFGQVAKWYREKRSYFINSIIPKDRYKTRFILIDQLVNFRLHVTYPIPLSPFIAS